MLKKQYTLFLNITYSEKAFLVASRHLQHLSFASGFATALTDPPM